MTAKKSVLVVDDEPKIVDMVRDYLETVGFKVITAKDGKKALEQIAESTPDIVVLDIMMPGIDGLDVIQKVRSESTIPIILLTARATEQDKLIGLEIGADDYITKPFSMKELAARIRAVLRRIPITNQEKKESENKILHGPVELNLDKRTVKRDGKKVELTGIQFDILARMLRHPGRVFTRMQLLESVQDYAFEGYERTVDVHIKNIRKTLEPNPSKPMYILTVWGVGYKINDDLGSE